MGLDIFLGVNKGEIEGHAVTLDDTEHEYLFHLVEKSAIKNPVLKKMEDYYSDTIIYKYELENLIHEICLLKGINESKKIRGVLDKLQDIAQRAIEKKRNIVVFCD